VELLDLGVEIVEDWYSVGNIEYDVGTLRFKDFIWLISFWVVCLSFMVLGNRYI
jgi:hypothetical protein